MPEGEPSFEEIERAETKRHIVETMREKGLEDETVRRAIQDWAKGEERRCPADAWEKSQIDIDLAQADMMAKAGFVAEAIEFLETTLMNAEQQSDGTLIRKIEAKITELKARS